MQRRDFLRASTALGLLGFMPSALLRAVGADRTAPAPGARLLDHDAPFTYAALKGRARALADRPHVTATRPLPEAVKAMTWDQYQSIRYLDEHALWANEDLNFRARFFHLGIYFHEPVHLHEVVDGRAREIAYDPAAFDLARSGLHGAALPSDLGFAGFRLNFHTDWQRDVSAFLGASYFRAVGSELQYGLSARGLAVDCALPRGEEFPRFTHFWLERPAPGSTRVVIYALLDSASVAGAYRFEIGPGENLVMDVDAALYPRRAIERLGVAPLTSMFQCGAHDKRMANDWRPQIHDSDGLALHTGTGEWIWRPLANPARLRFNAYADENPRGFGLLQRDREFDHYQDDGVFYNRRPSLWVEPKSGWGRGSVQLVEIPTLDETFDNIVAFWNPERPPRPGEELLFAYRLHWGARPPQLSPLARVVQTRSGIGGTIGRKRGYFSWRFVVDFAGGPVAMLPNDAKVDAVVSASRGEVELVSARPLAPTVGWRATFDVKLAGADDTSDPVNLRLFLRENDTALSETWLYQWTPPDDCRLP